MALHLLLQLLLIFLFIVVFIIPGILASQVDLDAVDEHEPRSGSQL